MYKGKITMSNVLLCIFFVSIDLVYHFLVITYWFSFSLCCSLFLSNRTLVHGFIILWIVASQLCYNVCLLPFCERVYSLQASREATAADSLNNRLFVIAFLLSIDRWRWWWRPSPRCTGHTGLSCQTEADYTITLNSPWWRSAFHTCTVEEHRNFISFSFFSS